MSTTLLALVVALGAAHLCAYYAGWRAVAGSLKALPVLTLAWAVWAGESGAMSGYAGLVALGLVLSAVGDVSLVFAGGFLAGLSAFFAAHLCYIAAFAPGATLTARTAIAAAGLAAVAAGILGYLWPYVARLRVPVSAYVVALSLMAWCAVARAAGPASGLGAVGGAVGSLSFLVSDGVLAVNRFARPFAGAHAVVMLTYYAAQILIAASAL